MIPMHSDVWVYKAGNIDDWGMPVQSDPIKLKGAVSYIYTRKQMMNAMGDIVVISATIALKGTDNVVEIGDSIVLPQSSYPEKKYDVHNVRPIYDLSGKVLLWQVTV